MNLPSSTHGVFRIAYLPNPTGLDAVRILFDTSDGQPPPSAPPSRSSLPPPGGQIPEPSAVVLTEVVVTTPRIQGLELHIPAGTTITDYQEKTVKEISLTPIPLDRTPFPLPRNVEVPLYFTAQPGVASLSVAGDIGARIYYPNGFNKLPGARFEFWHYDPDYRGWYVYGMGTVPPDGKQVIPDPGISVHEFTGAMVASPGLVWRGVGCCLTGITSCYTKIHPTVRSQSMPRQARLDSPSTLHHAMIRVRDT